MSRNGKGSLDECSVGQLRHLLELATLPVGGRKSLASAAVDPTAWRTHLNSLCQSEDQSGDILIEMICTPRTPVETLVSIKERAKRIHKKSKTEAERAASMILYHGAIAAAYAFHRRKVSSRSIRKLAPIFEDLAQALGTDDSGAVFRQAMKRYDAEVAEEA